MNLLQFFAAILGGPAADEVAAAGRIEKALSAITKAPFVQVLVPGCTARELPLQLNNLNNRVCTPDGRRCGPGQANDENPTLPRAKVASQKASTASARLDIPWQELYA